MPAQKSSARDGGYGTTYAMVGDAQDDHESHYNCTIEWGVYRYKKYKTASYKVYTVVCNARYRRDTPMEVCGSATCDVGHGSGAASMPGAMLSALIWACADLEKRLASPHKAQEVARLPGFEER